MLQLTLIGDDVRKLADVLERYLTWVDDTSADATRAPPESDARCSAESDVSRRAES
jgi:hypothetical protein